MVLYGRNSQLYNGIIIPAPRGRLRAGALNASLDRGIGLPVDLQPGA
jgi:hypothetical protein